ncbi:MATE family efflux transporter [Mollicutes bacterium LVI A0039]|nr:MATE family efflux transporter [Mollicutes bacterium LVI A0039]
MNEHQKQSNKQTKLGMKMLKLFLNFLCSNMLNALIFLINAIWVGKLLGENEVSVIANVAPIILVIASISAGYSTAVSVLVSKSSGAGEDEEVKNIMGFVYIFAFVVSISVSVLMIVLLPLLLRILNTPEIILIDTSKYMYLYLISYIINFSLISFKSALKAIEKVKLTLGLTIVEVILNAIFVPLLIMQFGVFGAVLGNISAKLLTLTLVIWINDERLKVTRNHLKIKADYVKQFISIASPITFDILMIGMLAMFETNIANQSGVLGSATIGVIDKLDEIVYIVSEPLQTVTMIIIAQYIGKKDKSKIKEVLSNSFKIAAAVMVFVAILIFVFPSQVSGLFIQSPTVIEMVVIYLLISGVGYVFLPIKQVLEGYLIAKEHSNYIFKAGIVGSIAEVVVIYVSIYNNVESIYALGIGTLSYVFTNIIIYILYCLRDAKQNNQPLVNIN